VIAPLYPCDAPEGGRALWLRAPDGVRLRVASWEGSRGQVLILPGRTEYIEKYGQVVAALAARGWGAVVLDWRGQGLSDRLHRDSRLGHIPRFDDYLLDIDSLRAAFPAPMPVLCHSMGGCITLRALMRGWRPPAVAFCAPMWGLALSPGLQAVVQGLARAAGLLRLDAAYAPSTGPDFGPLSMAFDTNPLTRDAAQFARMKRQLADHPDLIIGGPSLRWMAQARAGMSGLGPVPQVPALIGIAAQDQVVCAPAIRALVARWQGVAVAEYAGAGHELLMESPAVRDDFLARAVTHFDTIPLHAAAQRAP
jgi:lysophospholipase